MIRRKVLMSGVTVAQNTTVYSSSVLFDRCEGDVAILVISTAGSISIIQQCSLDDVTFYSPINASGSVIGTVCTAQLVTTGVYIAYSPVLAPYARFAVTENDVAASTVTLSFGFRTTKE